MKRIVRALERESIGCAQQYEDIRAKETMGLDQSKKHGEGRRLCAVSAIWQSNLPCCEDILERRRAKEDSMEGESSNQREKRGDFGRILYDAGSGQKRKLLVNGQKVRRAEY